jgi:hypothetical protein
MSAFAVAAFHDALLPAGATGVDAIVWVRPTGLGDGGAEVSLRVWTPVGASLAVLREVVPRATDLLASGAQSDGRTVEYPAGRWTDGAYEYELGVTLPERGAGDEMLAARVEVVVDGEVVGRAAVAVTWTADEDRLTAPGEGAGVVPANRAETGGGGAGDGAGVGDGAGASGGRAADGARAGDGAGADGRAGASGGGAADGAGASGGVGAGDGANADLPTGPSPEPRHTLAHAAHAGEPCPGCGEQTAEDDRFCEGCGSELAAR